MTKPKLMIPVKRGTCRFCGCTELHACLLFDDEPCAWVDVAQTICTNPKCLAKARAAGRL